MGENVKEESFIYEDSDLVRKAKQFLDGGVFTEEEIRNLALGLKKEFNLKFARLVLQKVTDPDPAKRGISDGELSDELEQYYLKECALAISKDPDLSSSEKHDLAMDTLKKVFPDQEFPFSEKRDFTANEHDALGVAGGILKRKFHYSGQLEDLLQSQGWYRRGYEVGIEADLGYTAINYAYLCDLAASVGLESKENLTEARLVREQIIRILRPYGDGLRAFGENQSRRWCLLTLAEAYLGIGDYDSAQDWTDKACGEEAAPWVYEVTGRQWASLIAIHKRFAHPEPNTFARSDNPWVSAAGYNSNEAEDVLARLLLGDSTDPASTPNSVDSVLIGKVGLALSGGGFRAAFYHLGVLARMAEQDILRHIDVLSCVSGGSIVGTAYFITLRKRLEVLSDGEITREDYCEMIRELTASFSEAVERNLRFKLDISLRRLVFRHGLFSSEKSAKLLEEYFYRPMWNSPFKVTSSKQLHISKPPPNGPIYMHDLNLKPCGFEPGPFQKKFNPKLNNWRRRNNVPALVLNATTLNTGHGWQFTTTWMGEWPYGGMTDVNSVSRLTRAWYAPDKGVVVTLGKAVAASAAVPGLFVPVKIDGLYSNENSEEPIDVSLIDGGGYDNQGTVNLMAQDCNVLLVSDAAGQLALEATRAEGPLGIFKFGERITNLFMERIRQGTLSELKGKLNAGLIRGLMFIHLKQGLDAAKIELNDSSDPVDHVQKSPSGGRIRKDFQRAISELRTDLDSFKPEEREALMALGYEMASSSIAKDIAPDNNRNFLHRLVSEHPEIHDWPFAKALQILTSQELDAEGERWLEILREGHHRPQRGKGWVYTKLALAALFVIGFFAGLGFLVAYFVTR